MGAFGEEFYSYAMPPAHKIIRRSLDATAPIDTLVAGSVPSLTSDGKLMAYVDYSSGNRLST